MEDMVKIGCGRLGYDHTWDQFVWASAKQTDRILDIKDVMRGVTKTTKHYGIKLRANARGKVQCNVEKDESQKAKENHKSRLCPPMSSSNDICEVLFERLVV